MAFDREIAALSIVCEADGGTHAERVMIAKSFFCRRDLRPAQYGASVAAVCLKRYQYSEWLPDAGDNANLERVSAMPEDHPSIAEAKACYSEASLSFNVKTDPTHFHAASEPPPDWAKDPRVTHLGQVGKSIFYKDVP